MSKYSWMSSEGERERCVCVGARVCVRERKRLSEMTIEVEGRERQDAGVPTLFPQDRRTIAVTL